MAQHTIAPYPISRRHVSALTRGIPLRKLKKDSAEGSIAISQKDPSQESPFLSPPITPVERDDVPYKFTEQDYFSVRQRRTQKGPRRTNRTSELSSTGVARSAATSPGSLQSIDTGSVFFSEPRRQHGTF